MKHAAAILGLVLTLACQQEQRQQSAAATGPAATESATALTPEQLGTLGAQIRKEPSRGDELLAQHGLTRESFEKAIRDVTENADASKRYTAAYHKAGA